MRTLKKAFLFLLPVILICLTASCGEKETDLRIAICTEERMAFDDPGIQRYYSLGVERYDDELIRLLALKDDGFDIYVQKEGKTAELTIDNVQIGSLVGGFIDPSGNYVIYGRNEVVACTPEGTETASFSVKETIRQLIPGGKGKYYALASEGSSYHLYELDLKGEKLVLLPIEMSSNEYNVGYLYYGGRNLRLVGGFGAYILDVGKGKAKKVFDFEGSAYSFAENKNPVLSIEYHDEKKLTVYHNNGQAETIEYVNVDREREILTVRLGRFNYGSLPDYVKAAAQKYNSKSKRYFVILEQFDGDPKSFDAFSSQTNAMLSSGDIDLLHLNASDANVENLIRNGKLTDLEPMFKKSGIDFDDYYPVVFKPFDTDTDGIYGVSLSAWGVLTIVDKDIVGSVDPDDFSLSSFFSRVQGAGIDVMLSMISDRSVLTNYFLTYSDSLCGSVDWEQRTCNFNNERFRQLAEAVKDNPGDSANRCASTFFTVDLPNAFISAKEADEKDNMIVLTGVFSDDGIYPAYSTGDEFAIPTNSKHKEAAMDFLCYLLSDEAQKMMSDYRIAIGKRSTDRDYVNSLIGTTVQHTSTNLKLQFEISRATSGGGNEAASKYVSDNRELVNRFVEIDADSMEEYLQTKEKIRACPSKNKALLSIISEELDAYYSGAKSFEEVCEILDNRVGNYLREHD